MAVTKYQRSVVETVLSNWAQGVTGAQMIDQGIVDISLPAIMGILRDEKIHGKDAICADEIDVFGDEPEEAGASVDPFTPMRRPHDFGQPETDEGAPEIPAMAAAQTRQVETRKQEAKRDLPRGKKPANTKDNIALNAERRRRRGGNPIDMRRRLLADQKALHPDFEYRWVLDRPGRIAEKTKFDDWDIVTDAHIMEGMGGNVQAIAGTNHYNADKMILLRKPKKYFQQDAQAKLSEVSELEDQIRRGPNSGQSGQQSVDNLGPKQLMESLKNGGLDRSNTYVPVGEKITIGAVSETP